MLKARAPLDQYSYPWPSTQFIDATTALRLLKPLSVLERSGHVKSVELAQIAEVRKWLGIRKKDIRNWCSTDTDER